MHLTIPFFYAADVDVIAGPNGAHRVVIDTMEIEIDEVQDADAPVALTCEDRSINWGRRTFRVYGDEFYGDFRTGKNASTRRLAPLGRRAFGTHAPHEMIEFLALTDAYPFRSEWGSGKKIIEQWWTGGEDVYRNSDTFIQSAAVKTFRDDARERRDQRMRTIERLARCLISVDGWMYYRTSEPTLVVGNGSISVYSEYGPPAAGHDIYKPNLQTCGRVRMSVLDAGAAEEYAGRTAPGHFDSHIVNLDVRMPEVFRFDAAAHHAMVTAIDLVFSLRDAVGSMPIEAANAWLELRTLVEEGKRGKVDTESLSSRLNELASWRDLVPERLRSGIDMLSKLVPSEGSEGKRQVPLPVL